MPNIVAELPKTNRGRAKKYEFLAELYPKVVGTDKAIELVPGEDYECNTASMRQFIYRDAGEHGFKAVVRTRENPDDEENDIIVFGVEKPDPSAKKRGRKPKNGDKADTEPPTEASK